MGYPANTPADFWARVDTRDTDECWVFTGTCDRAGYGMFFLKGQRWGAHRLAYTLAKGPIPPRGGYHGTVVMHDCDNPACCNPSHLSLGSMRDNLRDMVRKGRSTKGRATSRGAAGHANAPKRLSEDQVAAIRRDPRTTSEIAKSGDYPVSLNAIWRIKTGRGWRFVKDAA